MTPLTWTDPWFRRVFPPLLAVLLTLAALATLRPEPAPAPTAAAGTPLPPQAAVPDLASYKVRDTAGFVGPVRLGMTLEQARAVLGEPLVTVQEPTAGSRRFEVFARTAGLRLLGKHQTIDTITVTSTGDGRRFRTGKQLRIGDKGVAVPRRYTWAYKVCGKVWWVRRGKYTLRLTAERRITAITLTSRRAPTYVDCTAPDAR